MLKIYSLFLMLLLFSVFSQAQTFNPIISTEVLTTAIDGDVTNTGLVDYSDTTLFNTVLNISLFDTIGLASVHVILKPDQGRQDLLNKSFVFDVRGNFQDGTSYARNAYNISLGLGSYLGLIQYYAEVSIVNTSGVVSPVAVFSR